MALRVFRDMDAGAWETFAGVAKQAPRCMICPQRRLVAQTGRDSPWTSRKLTHRARRMPTCRSRAKHRE
eukprot:3368621-Pyramimonas_sp.AAC.1